MIKNIKLNRVYVSDKDKNDKKFISSNGKPYKKIAIYADGLPKPYASGFVWNDSDPCLAWQVGDTVKVVLEEVGQYLNFHIPRPYDYLEARIIELEKIVFSNSEELKDEDIPIVENDNDNPFQ